jgi:Mlc titration factor MtfA (ptsG expression regulator)
MIYIFILSLIFLVWLIWSLPRNRKTIKTNIALSADEITFMEENIKFYRDLNQEAKTRFEKEVSSFLSRITIEWIGTTPASTDKLLVAASAIIPICGFREWRYPNISTVIIYPATFNESFDLQGKERNILGMVGSGYMNGQMILSQEALRAGFQDHTLGSNTGIHEFVHLLDKADGTIDGLPENLLHQQYVLPWLDLVQKEIRKIKSGKSDIAVYGATNESEFLAVVSEYFFERPETMKDRHPELYHMLEMIFKQDLARN